MKSLINMDPALLDNKLTYLNQGFNLTLLFIGVFTIVLSLSYKNKRIQPMDKRFFLFLHNNFRFLVGAYRYFWPIGTTPVGTLFVMMTYIGSIRSGLIVSVVFLSLLIVERIIKIILKRKRPFESISGVISFQPIIPNDPSYPSGDAMRLMFLTFIIPFSFSLSPTILTTLLIICLFFTLGRIVLGVHYPLDVLGGIGLGITGSAIAFLAL